MLLGSDHSTMCSNSASSLQIRPQLAQRRQDAQGRVESVRVAHGHTRHAGQQQDPRWAALEGQTHEYIVRVGAVAERVQLQQQRVDTLQPRTRQFNVHTASARTNLDDYACGFESASGTVRPVKEFDPDRPSSTDYE